MTSETKVGISINPLSAQFEAVRNATVVGLLAYDRAGSHFDLRHTFVPTELRGQHIAHALVTTALDQIRGTPAG